MVTDHAPAVAPLSRRQLGALVAGSERFTQARVERIMSLVIALGCAVLGTQAFLNALGSTQEESTWRLALMIAAFVPLALMIVSLTAGVLGRLTSRICTVALIAVIACWPFATAGIASDPSRQPWIWYLLNVATAAAVMAFRMPVQLGVAVIVPALYALVRLIQVGTARVELIGVVRDAAFAMILAGVIIALGWMLRGVAVVLDRARADAVASYAAAAEADAAEAERVAVAALMHDSVLAALIAAERAETPRGEDLAVAMAREALTRLANAENDVGEGPDDPVTAESLRTAIVSVTADLGAGVPVTAHVAPSAAAMPGRVARAISLATRQAASNAIEHAGARGLAVEVTADAAKVTVRIIDAGDGFDPAAVPADRLGIRGSILARMAAVGGSARVHTDASGTVVRLDWEQPT